jgi:hypothetical protein
MAGALVGLVSWPLMSATISTEGTDSWEAVTRAYGYIYQRPWHCLGYALLSVLYGGIVIFFVGFMGSLTVYLAKWGVSRAPMNSYLEREPHYLFVYAPTSFGWRELLLEGATVHVSEKQLADDPDLRKYDGADVVSSRGTRPESLTAGVGGINRWTRIDPDAYDAYERTMSWGNKLGAWLTTFWLGLTFLLVLSVGYVFFWTANTIIYMLLRRSLESAEMDEVYMEDETLNYRMPTHPTQTHAPAPSPGPARGTALPVVEPSRALPTPAPTPEPGKDGGTPPK